jgi:hypothetical protein
MGSGFRDGMTIAFGQSPASIVGAVTNTSVTVSAPPRGAPFTLTADVTVTNTDKQSATFAAGFMYVIPGPTPHVTSVSPGTGSIAGGEVVTIQGSGFVAGATISFGGSAATVVSSADTTIVVLTPPAPPGLVDVTVTNPDQQSATLAAAFDYSLSASPFRIMTVTPNVGLSSGGTPVVIAGTGFQPHATVLFGTNSATVTASSPTSLSVAAPPALRPVLPGFSVNVTVVNPDGRMAIRLNAFTYASALYLLKVENQNAVALGGVFSSPAGIGNCAGICSAIFASGTTVILTTEAAATAAWTGCDGVNLAHTQCVVVMNSDKTVIVR